MDDLLLAKSRASEDDIVRSARLVLGEREELWSSGDEQSWSGYAERKRTSERRIRLIRERWKSRRAEAAPTKNA
jgi:hypothetical protein